MTHHHRGKSSESFLDKGLTLGTLLTILNCFGANRGFVSAGKTKSIRLSDHARQQLRFPCATKQQVSEAI